MSGEVVAGNDLARGIERYRRLERRQFVQALPAIVEGDPRLGLEPAARRWTARRGRAVAVRSMATASSGKGVAPAGSEGAVTGGCFEGMRGCSAHEANIARRKEQIKNIVGEQFTQSANIGTGSRRQLP